MGCRLDLEDNGAVLPLERVGRRQFAEFGFLSG